jgi:predicted dienelactone hydrolase
MATVIAADFPLSHAGAPGGPTAADVIHQPSDVTFLIDQALGLPETERPFAAAIDAHRIGVFGLSLGAVTTTLVTFHSQ